MRLRSFRIRGFRCIKDSNTVSVKDITALIGRNESGKTAMLHALQLLNKDSAIADVDLTDGLETEVAQPHFRVVEGRFELSDSETQAIKDLASNFPVVRHMTIYREATSSQPAYAFEQEFPLIWQISEASLPAFLQSIDPLIAALQQIPIPPTPATAPEGKIPQISAQIANSKKLLEALKATPKAQLDQLQTAQQSLAELALDPAADKTMDAPRKNFLAAAAQLFKQVEGRTEVEALIRAKFHPRFVYFSSYKTIHGAIKLSQHLAAASTPVSEKLDSGENLDKRETIANLFFLAQLDPKQLDALKSKITALNKYLQRCSANLTKEIQGTWIRDDANIECEIVYGDDVVRLKISDVHPDGSRTNQQLLQRRSEGFKWHFSFHINFRAETKRADLKEAILLLDEPGLHLHPAQQEGLLKVLRDLASENQILYSTHSPFMIFNYEEGNLLLVETDPQSHLSKVNPAFWNGDNSSILPILHSLGAKLFSNRVEPELARQLPPVIVVEGGTDYQYLKTFLRLFFLQAEEGTIKRTLFDFDIRAVNGSSAIGPSALFERHIGRKVCVIYDNEPDAKGHSQELIRLGFPGELIIFIDPQGKQEADIEDMFSETYYLNAVNEFYKVVLKSAKYSVVTKADLKTIRDQNPKVTRIVPVLELIWDSHKAENWGTFSKMKVCEKICLDILQATKVEEAIAEKFVQLFTRVQQAVAPKPEARAKSTEQPASPLAPQATVTTVVGSVTK